MNLEMVPVYETLQNIKIDTVLVSSQISTCHCDGPMCSRLPAGQITNLIKNVTSGCHTTSGGLHAICVKAALL